MARTTRHASAIHAALASLEPGADPIQRATVDLAPVPDNKPATLGRKQVAWLMSKHAVFKDMVDTRRRNARDLAYARRQASKGTKPKPC